MGWLSRLIGREAVEDLAGIRHGMDRRSFLRTALLGTVAVATLDIEQILWVPKAQIVVPDLSVVKIGLDDWVEIDKDLSLSVVNGGNAFITPEWITREALRLLNEQLTFTKRLMTPQGFGMGDMAFVRKPARFTVSESEAFDPMAITLERDEAVKMDRNIGVTMDTDQHYMEPPMTRDQYRRRSLIPAVASLAYHMEASGMNVIASPGVPDVHGFDYLGVATDPVTQLAVRGRKFSDPVTGRTIFSLDVMGGYSETLAEEDHRNELRTSISESLDLYPSLERG